MHRFYITARLFNGRIRHDVWDRQPPAELTVRRTFTFPRDETHIEILHAEASRLDMVTNAVAEQTT